MEKMKYVGCFLDKDEITELAGAHRPLGLARPVAHPHVTFLYRPEETPYDQFGAPVTLRVVGYGRDEENEAFAVTFEELPAGLADLANEIRCPHITISVSETGKAVNSGNLEFHPIPPFTLRGIFGGMGFDGIVHTKKHCV